MMKKIFLTATLIVASFAPSWAQKHQKKTRTRVTIERTTGQKVSSPVRVNLYAGCELSNVKLFAHGLEITSERELYNPTVGADVRIPINNSGFFISPGLSYNRKGMRFSSNAIGSGVVTIRTPIHFISGDVLGGFKIGDEDFSFIAACGLYTGYAISGKAMIKYSEGSGRVVEREYDLYDVSKYPELDFDNDLFGNKVKVNNKSPLNRFDLGIRASVGFEFANHYTLTFTGNQGLINQSNDETIRLFHNTTTITVGYTF